MHSLRYPVWSLRLHFYRVSTVKIFDSVLFSVKCHKGVKSMKLMLVCTSGGHFSTMRRLESFWSNHERIWVTDPKLDTKSLEKQEKVYWLPYQAPRDIWALWRNIPRVFKIVYLEQPDVVISTGASIAIGFAVAAKLLRKRFVYVESISRSEELSLSGKLVYRLSDEFYVQWPNLCRKYPKAIFKGYA